MDVNVSVGAQLPFIQYSQCPFTKDSEIVQLISISPLQIAYMPPQDLPVWGQKCQYWTFVSSSETIDGGWKSPCLSSDVF